MKGQRPGGPMADVVVIRRFSYRHEAELVRSVLEAGGVGAFVTSDDCGAVDPALGLVRGVCVAVPAEDVDRSEDILASGPDEDISPDESSTSED